MIDCRGGFAYKRRQQTRGQITARNGIPVVDSNSHVMDGASVERIDLVERADVPWYVLGP
jgi:hypothetical protein